MSLRMEHTAIQVPDPAKAAAWYVQHMGMSVSRSYDAPTHCRFLSCAGGTVLIEIYNNPKATVPDYRKMDPLHLHLAFLSDDLPADRARLMEAGATPETEVILTPDGDYVVMLRDPWGVPIQLVKRKQSML